MRNVRFLTLGPAGTCHEYAVRRYLEFQGLKDYELGFVDDFVDAIERLRRDEADFVVQNSAHPQVVECTERYHREVFVVDTFLCPTKELAVLSRRDVARPRSLGLMPATRGYVDLGRWETHTFETANPVVGRGLIEGKYDSGVTLLEFAERYPEQLSVVHVVGSVDTAWLVYGRRRRLNGNVLAVRDPALFQR